MRRIPQKYLNLFFVFISLLIYNSVIIYRYLTLGKLSNPYVINSYQFTYQRCGFISRGLLPSIFETLDINNLLAYFIFLNIIIILYVLAVANIASLYKVTYRNYFIISFLFFFFGIPHFALDTFRFDSLTMLLVLYTFILLHRKLILLSFIVSLLSLFIHEASIFLFVPIFFLLLGTKLRWIISVILIISFVIISLSSNKLSEKEAINVLQNSGYDDIDPLNYAGQTLNIKENIYYFFNTYNVSMFLLYGLVYIIVLFYCFSSLFKSKINEYRWMFLVPLILCLIAVDYFRWYCFVYFLAMLYALHLKIFTKKSMYFLLFTTILLGIPLAINTKYGIMPLLFYLLH
jgi:hypothetical protein